MDAMKTFDQEGDCTMQDSVVDELKLWFAGIISSDIIELIAYECGNDVERAKNHLIEMIKDVQIPNEQENPQQGNGQQRATTSDIAPSHESDMNIQRIIQDVGKGIKILILMRGLPGSGKSYTAHKIIEQIIGNCATAKNFILSADDFFYVNGSYNYNSSRIFEAHNWIQKRAHKLIKDGISPIIIDNTNTQICEMKPYCVWAVEHGYAIKILEPSTPWAFDNRELARRNTHQLSRSKIRSMMGRYEKNITVEKLFEEFDLCYRPQMPLEPVILRSPKYNGQKKGKDLKHLVSDIEINRDHCSPHKPKIKETRPVAGPSQQIDMINFDNEDEMEISDDSDAEDMLQLNLGEHFVQQLDMALGNLKVEYPKEWQPIIEIPKSLGKQLYALYLESICNQLEAQRMLMKEMLEQDEKFVIRLQEEELCALEQPDQNVQKRSNVMNQKDWENLTPDEFIEMLVKHRICNYFPYVDVSSLRSLLAASNNCYKTAVTSLWESGLSTTESLEKIREPVISDSELQTLRDAYNDSISENINFEEVGVDPKIIREKAKICQQKHKRLLEESNCYHSRGQYEVSYFYFGLAKRQTNLYDQYRILAAEQTLTNNFNKNPSLGTIDLHYLTVEEARNALDRFLDRNIMLLREDNAKSRSLLIITGRGKNSPGGIPRIKPAVKKRLLLRGIKFVEANPGLLHAYISKDSLMTSSIHTPDPTE